MSRSASNVYPPLQTYILNLKIDLCQMWLRQPLLNDTKKEFKNTTEFFEFELFDLKNICQFIWKWYLC